MKAEQHSYARLKAACYTTNISMSVVANLSPILFLGFHELYGISFASLGLLVLINFSTQLAVDLLISFFSHRMNTGFTLKMTPVLTFIGLVVFALAPNIFPDEPFIGLALGTVIYAASGGLSEALISPVIAAIPSDNPEREVSKLHSIYAWGVVAVVPFASVFLLLFNTGAWQILALICSVIPLIASILYLGTELPRIEAPEKTENVLEHFKNPTLWLMVLAIFFGGAIECTMSQWASGYIEGALGIDKIYGDIFGVTLFAVMLGLGRTLYSKFGKSPEKILFIGAIGALVCYITAALSPLPIIGLVACALCGLCASMLWPGSLIVSAERIPTGGVLVYALMAAGGDLGASVGPQLVGAITDAIALELSDTNGIAIPAYDIGLRAGMLVGALFALIGTLIYLTLIKTKNVNNE